MAYLAAFEPPAPGVLNSAEARRRQGRACSGWPWASHKAAWASRQLVGVARGQDVSIGEVGAAGCTRPSEAYLECGFWRQGAFWFSAKCGFYKAF